MQCLPIAEPNPNHLLLHREAVRQHSYFFGGGLWILEKGLFQRHSYTRFYRRPFLPPPADRFRRREWIRQRIGIVQGIIGVLQPLLQ